MNSPDAARHVSILWAGMADTEALAALHAPLFDMAWDASSFQRLIGDPQSIALLARTGRPAEIAGFVLGQLAADEAEILTLGVRDTWQRRGIGRKLVEALCRAARKAEARRLYLEVAVGNAAALNLYKQLGFEQAGRRKGYYERPGAAPEDAINLALAL